MNRRRIRTVCTLVAIFGWSVSFDAAAQTAQSELYHIHFVKAAPGKLMELIEAYKAWPPPDKSQPQVNPLILRHRQGAEWDILVITPMGTEVTLSAAAPPPEIQKGNEQLATISEWHGDTFVVGPAWETVRQALVPDAAAEGIVYLVSDYRAMPGHRPQLRQNLEEPNPGTNGDVLFTHMEGAPWNYLLVSRYPSWASLGAPAPAGQDQGVPIRDHLAVHHDTLAMYVWGGTPIR